MTLPAEAERPHPRLKRRNVSSARRSHPVRQRLRAIPAPLASILAIVVIAGLAWALILPPWQSPDEDSHFAYAQSLAERFALPGDPSRPGWSSDQSLAEDLTAAFQNAHFSAQLRFSWNPQAESAYRAADAHNPSRSNGGGPNSAATNPPLYYLYADLAYWATSAGNAFDRLYAMRIWSVGLLAATVLAAWLLAGEVLGRRRRLPQLACAAVAGLIPTETSIASSVNPDGLVFALSTFALWLGARVITRAARPRDVVSLSAVTAAAILTKATSYALVPPALVAVLFGWLRCPPEERRALLRPLAMALIVLAAPVLGWIGFAHSQGRPAFNQIQAGSSARPQPFNIRQFLSYVWQFYAPRLPWLTPLRTTVNLPIYDIWLKQGWGVFGWLELFMPGWVYPVLTAVTGLIAAASAAIIVRFRDRVRLELLAFFAVALLSLLFGLHETEYRTIIANQSALLQGRYLLPLVGLFGLAAGLIISRIPARWRGPACGALLAALLLVQVLALATVAQGYYS